MWSTVVVPTVVQQHAEEAALLWQLRTAGVKRPNFAVQYLDRFDRRLEAHLDGLAVAGEAAWPFCEAALEDPSAGVVFTAAERAVQEKDGPRLDRLIALTLAVPQAQCGLHSAFGWVERERLQGLVARLLASDEPSRRTIGIAACALHRVDPGMASLQVSRVADSVLRARTMKAIGELGLTDFSTELASVLADDNPDCRFWAAWALVLLGNHHRSLDVLREIGATAAAHRRRAFHLALQAMDEIGGRDFLGELRENELDERWLIEGTALVGDPAYVPWLLTEMSVDAKARLAGQAFTMITGADLLVLRLERRPPEGVEFGPTDDPADPDVAMDADDGLPWPDTAKVEKWWATNSGRFHKGRRYFLGAPVTREHCIGVLKNGYQHQRILAAHYLCLLEPGTPLFNTSAPAWRQQRLLAKMG